MQHVLHLHQAAPCVTAAECADTAPQMRVHVAQRRSLLLRSTFFFRIKRRSAPLLPDGRPPLRLHHPPADGSAPVSSHYTECKSPYIYG